MLDPLDDAMASPTMQDAVSLLRRGIGAVDAARLPSALSTLHRPLGAVLAETVGDRATVLAPWLLGCLVLEMFDITPEQGTALADLIGRHAAALSISQWITALSHPRHERRGALVLRAFQTQEQQDALARTLDACAAGNAPQPPGLTPIAKALPALAAAAAISTVAPPLAIPVALAGGLGYLGLLARDLSASTAISAARETAAIEQADAFLATMLPCWSPQHRADLYALWSSHPNHWSLLDAALAAHDQVAQTGCRIPDALNALRQQNASPPRSAHTRESAADALLALCQLLYSGAPHADAARIMDHVNAAIGASPHTTHSPSVHRRGDQPNLAVGTDPQSGLTRIAEHNARQDHLQRLRQDLDAPRMPGTRMLDHRERIARTRLAIAHFTEDPVERGRNVKEARDHLDSLINPIGHVRHARTGDIKGAMQAEKQAARAGMAPLSHPRVSVPTDVHQSDRTNDDTATSTGASSASTWLTSLLAYALCGTAARTLVTIENTPLNVPVEPTQAADATDATAALLPPTARMAAGSAGGIRRLINRNPIIATAAAVTTGAGLAAAGATALYRALANGRSAAPPSQPEITTPSTANAWTATQDTAIEEINQLFNTEVTLPDGSWGTAADQHYGLLASTDRSGRQRRDARAASVSTPTPTISPADSLGNAPSSPHPNAADIARSQHAVALLTADTIAAKRGEAWDWLKYGTESEKVLWASQLHALNATVETLRPFVAMPQAWMKASLHDAGWPINQAWQDITITLPRKPGSNTSPTLLSRMALPDDTLSLMDFCTSRDTMVPATATFARSGQPLDASQSSILRSALNSAQCRNLPARLDHAFAQHRDTVIQARLQRMKLDATTAKMRGRLGGRGSYQRGAEIVMGFFSGRQDIEWATPDYRDTLPDGQSIRISLPNYLVLRARTPDDEAMNGQLVLYRTDTGSFDQFEDSDAFHQFINERSARLHPMSDPDQFTTDILRAAPQRHQAELRSLLARREQGGHYGWDAERNLQLSFERATSSSRAPQRWCASMVAFEERLRGTDVNAARLNNSPLGTLNDALTRELDVRLGRDLTGHLDYARPIASAAFSSLLGLADLDTDQIEMRCNGVTATLTEWALHLWGKHGPKREVQILNPAMEPGMGTGGVYQWPDQHTLNQIHLTARHVDANDTQAQKDVLQRTINAGKQKIVTRLETYAASESLIKDYKKYLRDFQQTPNGRAFIENSVDAAKVRMQWMIESSFMKEIIDTTTRDALLAAREKVDAHTSTHKRVTLNDRTIHGLWALEARGSHYVFIQNGPHGDEILEEDVFRQWLLTPEAEGFIAKNSGYRYHNLLADAFGTMKASEGLKVGFVRSRGLWPDTLDYINKRIDDIDEMFPTGERRTLETLKLVGAIITAMACAAAPFPPAVIACLGGTLTLLPVAMIDGVDMLDRGDVNGAVGEIGGGIVSILDPFDATKLAPLLFRVGKTMFRTPDDVADALRLAAWQNAGFDSKGVLTDLYATTSYSRSPSTVTSLPEEAPRIVQDDIDYVVTGSGSLVRVDVDDATGVIRVHAPNAPDKLGAPIHDANGEWVLQDVLPSAPHIHVHQEETQLIEAIPRAYLLPDRKQREISSLFGAGRQLREASPDLEHVVDVELMRERIDMMIQSPHTIGLPGDEAVLLRAWSDSRVLGGRQIWVLVDEGDDAGPRLLAKFGKDSRHSHDVIIDEDEDLPSLAWLVDQEDPSLLASRLGMSPDLDKRTLLTAVKRELSKVIARDRVQSLKTWMDWKSLVPPSSVASDNLRLHYPELTVAEADYIMRTASDQHRALVEDWSFPDHIHQRAAWMVAARLERTQRQEIIDGVVQTRGAAKDLVENLQEVLPARRWELAPESDDSITISFPQWVELTGKERIIISADGHVSTPDDATRFSTWQDAILPQLTPQETAWLGDSTALHRQVTERMRHLPLPSTCALMTRPRHRIRRVVPELAKDACRSLAVGISLTDNERHAKRLSTDAVISGRDQLTEHNRMLQEPIDRINSLKMIKTRNRTPEQIREIESLPDLPQPDPGISVANLAHYAAEDMTFQGKRISFPSGRHKFALSGDRAPLTDEFLDNVPIRITYEAHGASAKELTNKYTETYPFGATVAAIENEPEFVLSAEDMIVTTGIERVPTPLGELKTDIATALVPGDYSPRLQQLLEKKQPALPENLRGLKPDTPYVVSQIRSCSESKIIQDLVDAIRVVDNSIMTRINNPEPILDLRGVLTITSEMSPCATSCAERLQKMYKKFKHADFDMKFYYLHEKNGDRTRANKARKRQQDAYNNGMGPPPAPLVSRFWDPAAEC